MHMPLVGSTDRALWGSQTEARFVNSNQKRVEFGGASWSQEAGEDVYHKGLWGSHIRNLTFTHDSSDCCLGHALVEGASVSSTSL